MSTKKTPIIIDCDPGCDDALALILAFASEKLDVLAVTCVAGNQTLDKTSENARKVITFLDKKVPVALGATKPLLRELSTAGEVHGETGLDGPKLPEPNFDFENEPAWELQRNIILKSKEPVTIVAVGPLTNIATLLTAYPEVKHNIERICIMGGGIKNGNITATAEFNMYVDPEAGHIVFNAGIPMVMCGLDITEKAYITKEQIEELRSTNKKVAIFAAELLSFYIQFHLNMGFEGCHVHDACVIAYLLHPEFFKTEDMFVTVETEGRYTRGMTVADRRHNVEGHVSANPSSGVINQLRPNVTVCTKIDRIALYDFLKESCVSYG